jgi:hypothetical protein
LNLTIDAVATESSNGDTAVTSQTVTVNVVQAFSSGATLADPQLVFGNEGQPIPLGLSASIAADTDGSETLSMQVKVNGVASDSSFTNPIPGGADLVVLSHGVKQPDGSWLVDGSDISDLAVSYPNGEVFIQLNLTAISTEKFNGSEMGVVKSQNIRVDNVAPTLQVDATDPDLNEGDTFSRSGSFTDPGTETWVATVNYGDGLGA